MSHLMKDDLSGFNGVSSEEDLSSFSTAPVEKSVKSEASDVTVAMQGALLANSPEELEKVVGSEDSEAQLDVVTDRVHHETMQASLQQVSELTMGNPELGDAYIASLSNLAKDKPTSLDMLSEKAGLMPSGEEGARSEDIRIDSVEISREVNRHLQEQQALLNGFGAADPGSLGETADLLEMFVPLSDGIFLEEAVRKMREGDVGASVKAFTWLGGSKADFRDFYQGMDFDQQGEFQRRLAKVVNGLTGIVFTNDNGLAKKDLFMSVVDGTYYGSTDEVVDNIFGILDLVGVGLLLRPARVARMADKLSKIGRRRVRSEAQPTSPANVVGQVNPEEARELQAAAEAAPDDSVARATHGSSKQDAVVDSEAPQVKNEDGSVEAKAGDLGKYVENFLVDGKIDMSDAEVLRAQKVGTERLQRIQGITNRRALATDPIYTPEGKTIYSNVYGPADSSYKTPQEGIDNVMFSLRDYGIEEADITILQKNVDGDYAPVNIKDYQGKVALREAFVKKKQKLPEELKKANMQDDFLMRVNFEHDINIKDGKLDELTVTGNWLDRIPFFNRAQKGLASLQRYFVDIHSMLDPRLTLGANVAVEKASAIETALVKHADSFIKPFRTLENDRQVALMAVIRDSNYASKTPDKVRLRAEGFKQDELDLLDTWKETWDNVWHLENRDLIKSLNARGYKWFEDGAGTKLISRELSQGNTSSVRRVYDAQLDKVRDITTAEIGRLYGDGGTLAELRSPTKHNGVNFEHVIVKNKEGSSFTRKIQPNDRALDYREGYYTVRYKDPHIITRNKVDEDGRVVESQAIQTSGNKKDAQLAIDNLNSENVEAGVVYKYRDNTDLSVGQMEDDAWSIHTTTGRTSQRMRGERLGETKPNLQGDQMGSVEGPAEALENSIRSISRRTGMRDYVERYKDRFMSQYSDLLQRDTASGQLKFPRSADDLILSDSSSSKRLADARTNLEYINYLENGYRNSLDDAFKASLHGIANALGGKSKTLEKGIRAVEEETGSLTGWFKGRAFEAYLALNPLRQIVVQSHQSTMLASTFTKYVGSQKLAQDLMAVHMAMIAGDKLKNVKGIDKLLGHSADDALALAEEYKKTGFDATIDRNNLVENGLDNLVETGRLAKLKKPYKAVVGVSRKYGFDVGERVNIMSSWLAHRNKALEENKDLSSVRVREEVIAKARNFTFNMNAAGDMPYNKTSLAMLFQFMQVPHKAMLQMTNRAIPVKDRVKIGAYNTLVMPAPVGIGYWMASELEIEDPDLRDLVANRLEGYVFNKMASMASGERTDIDFSSLASQDPNAPIDLITGMFSLNIPEVLSSSPSATLWAGHNPRAWNVIKAIGNFVTEPQNISVRSSLELMDDFASFSSGYLSLSRGWKEMYVQEYDRRYNSSGLISDGTITTPEKIAGILGFGTKDEAYARVTSQKLYEASQDAKNDVKEIVRAQSQQALRRGINVDDPRWDSYMHRAYWAATDFTEGMSKLYLKEVSKKALKGEDTVIEQIMNSVDYVPFEETIEAIHGSGNQDKLKEMLHSIEHAQELGE